MPITSALLLALALSTVPLVRPGFPPPQDSALGRTVTQLDARIWCLHQAANGDRWFGSNGAGIYRHDGKVLTQFTREHGLAGNAVRAIQEDEQGRVLVAAGGGVSRFDGERFDPLEIVKAPAGEGWILDPGDIWIVADPGDGGPWRYDGEKVIELELSKSPAAATERDRSGGFSQSGIYSTYRDRRGHIWFGTAGVGLCRYDGQNLDWMYEERLTSMPGGGQFGIRSIFEDRAGDFWICNTRQRYRFESKSKVEGGFRRLQYESKVGLPASQSDDAKHFNYYPSIVEDAEGVLWMAGGSEGVTRFDGKAVRQYAVGEGAYVLRVYLDRKGMLWAGTLEQGAYRLGAEGFLRFEP